MLCLVLSICNQLKAEKTHDVVGSQS
eukprot:SAG31_NODE_5145_length_2716_cov_1.567826_1_plen_25_part_10